MIQDERERAERWIKANWPIDLGVDGEPWEDDVYCLLTLMREERARAYEEAAYYLEYKASGPIPPDAIDHMVDCAKTLREDGR